MNPYLPYNKLFSCLLSFACTWLVSKDVYAQDTSSGKLTIVCATTVGHYYYLGNGKSVDARQADTWRLLSDSVKSICNELYSGALAPGYPSGRRIDSFEIQVSVDELFPGYFSDVKISLITCTAPNPVINIGNRELIAIGAPVSYRLYTSDAHSGARIDINTVAEFNRLIGYNTRLTNLDKCYLYLSLVDKVDGILTDISNYRKPLSQNSMLLTGNIPAFYKEAIDRLKLDFDLQKLRDKHRYEMEEEVGRSTKNNIRMFAIAGSSVIGYRFMFNKNGQLENIVKKTLQ
jgi:hypothetical protein